MWRQLGRSLVILCYRDQIDTEKPECQLNSIVGNIIDVEM